MRWKRAIALFAPAAALAAGTLACGSPSAVEPRRYESEHFVVLDYAGVPPALADSFAARLEADYAAVTAFFPTLRAPPSIVANIFPGWGLPSMTIGGAELTQWAANLSFDYDVHLLIHIMTGYGNDQFLEEGLAVYGTEMLVPDSRTVEPYRGQVPHAWTSLFAGFGTVIPFDVLYTAQNVVFQPEGSFVDASAWQFYVLAGSFTRWVFDTYGREAWWRLYEDEPRNAVLQLDDAAIEAQWIADATALYPDPLSCADALGRVDFRESFWCALAEGRLSQ